MEEYSPLPEDLIEMTESDYDLYLSTAQFSSCCSTVVTYHTSKWPDPLSKDWNEDNIFDAMASEDEKEMTRVLQAHDLEQQRKNEEWVAEIRAEQAWAEEWENKNCFQKLGYIILNYFKKEDKYGT